MCEFVFTQRNRIEITKAEIVIVEILRRPGETNQAIARRLGINGGAVREHLKRVATKRRNERISRTSVAAFRSMLNLGELVISNS